MKRLITPEEFRTERLRRNFNQSQFAEQIGEPVIVVCRVESGDLRLHPEDMEKWWNTLQAMGFRPRVKRMRRRVN
jgi:ribosome-binding protein aMBF1 (putative translation factor)